jgi:hypothetical protein
MVWQSDIVMPALLAAMEQQNGDAVLQHVYCRRVSSDLIQTNGVAGLSGCVGIMAVLTYVFGSLLVG